MVGQVGEERLDLAEVRRVVEGAVVGVGVGRRAGAGALGLGHQQVDELVVDAAVHDHAGRGGAVLTGVEVRRRGDEPGRAGQVGVGRHHDRRLAAELEVGALEVLRRGRRDLDAGTDGPGDRDQAGRRVLDEQPSRRRVAVDDVEHAGRQDRAGDLGEQHGGAGRGVARLEHDRVAGGEGGGDLPDGHREGVVPGRHLADDADRLAADARGVPLEVLPRRLALEQPRGSREEPELVHALVDLLARDVAHRLAGVARLHLADLVAPRGDRSGEVEQVGLPAPRRQPLPRLRRTGRRGVRPVDLLGGRDGRAAVHLAGDRVDQVDEVGRGRLDELAVDEVADRVSHRDLPLRRRRSCGASRGRPRWCARRRGAGRRCRVRGRPPHRRRR